MKRSVCSLLLGLGVLAVMFALAQQSHATLGEPADSVKSDRKMLAATRGSTTSYTSTDQTIYTVHEMTYNATAVREYVSPSGIVFGIAWNGYTNPDLTQLLGAYYEEYKSASEQTPRKYGVKHRQVKTDRVVVETWGHMRDLQGRAYAPDLIPDGVSADDIK